MKKIYSWVWTIMSALLLASCAATVREASVAYDLGSLHEERFALPAGMPPFLLAEPQVPEWLDGTAMHYRLTYANSQQSHAYANSRWSMPPGKLLEQRLKSRIAATGGVVLPARSGTPSGTLLRMELVDFSQRFGSYDSSMGRVELRVSAFNGRILLGQKTFVATAPASSADAAGGAKALAVASDTLIDELLVWMAGLAANG